METKDIAEPNPWQPGRDTSQRVLAAVGKLGEEAGELASACCRILIQGINESDPGTGKVNRQRLLDEIADVRAVIELVLCQIEISETELHELFARMNRKYDMKVKWMELVNER
jgi:hypothetical protein